jgi:hypothetical protein
MGASFIVINLLGRLGAVRDQIVKGFVDHVAPCNSAWRGHQFTSAMFWYLAEPPLTARGNPQDTTKDDGIGSQTPAFLLLLPVVTPS